MNSAADGSDTGLGWLVSRARTRLRNPVPFDGISASVIYSTIGIIVAATLTLLGWHLATQRQLERGNAAFAAISADTRQALRHRLDNYATALDGAAALHIASNTVTAREWESYVTSLDLDRALSGIRGVGYVVPVSGNAAQAFVRQARTDGSQMSAIHPLSDRAELFPIKYIAPLEANRAALGLDLAFEDGRATALRRARSTGELTLTRKITLVQDSKKGSGFLLVRPIYAKAAPANFAAEREKALVGWTYLALVADDFLSELTPRQGRAFDVAMYQGSTMNADTLIYESNSGIASDHEPLYKITEETTVAGQTWTVEWHSLPEFEYRQQANEPLLVLLGGGAICLCLGALLVTLSRRESQVRSLVHEATAKLDEQACERGRMLDELQEKNRLLLLTETVAHTGHWRLDFITDHLYFSPETFAIHGLPNGPQPPLEMAVEAFQEDDRAMVAEHFANARNSGQDFTFRARLIQRSGEIRHVESRGIVEQAADGTAIAMFGVLIDKTDEVRLLEELTAARDAAESAMQAKGAFLANMSHEIRTPMNGVVGFADLLLRSDLTTDQRQQVQLIAESGRAMTLLLNDILDLSKIEAGELATTREPVALHHIARHAIRVVEPSAREKNLSLDLKIDDDVPEAILGDGLRLRQVLLNLIGNAVKFTDRGLVSLTLQRAGSTIECSVRDTGIGIPADGLEAIFGDFVQIGSPLHGQGQSHGQPRGPGQRVGTGLGLAISARLAALMGGTLKAYSIVGTGSTFVLRIPIHEIDRSGAAEAYGAAANQAGELVVQEGDDEKLRTGRVLLAEDYDINQMLIAAMAEEAGVELVIAENGRVAVSMVEQAAAAGDPFALVLMDMQMPEMDGMTAARELRKRGFAAAELPIVALTANAYPEDIDNCLAAGMQAHCSKPLSMDRFEQILRRWLPGGDGPGLIEVAA